MTENEINKSIKGYIPLQTEIKGNKVITEIMAHVEFDQTLTLCSSTSSPLFVFRLTSVME